MIFSFLKRNKSKKKELPEPSTPELDKVSVPFTKNPDTNVKLIKEAMGNSSDILVRDLTINGTKAKLIYLYTLADNNLIQQVLDGFLSSRYSLENSSSFNMMKLDAELQQRDIFKNLLTGMALLFIDGHRDPYHFNALSDTGRSVSEPVNENVLIGSHEAYVESLQANLYLLRKNLLSPNLIIKQIPVGKESEHTVAIAYLNNVADVGLVKEIEARIKSIDVDNVFSQSDLVAYIEDYTTTPFPQCLSTERPDRTVGNIMEGRIALFIEGSPSTSILPVSFYSFMQAADDYNLRFLIASLYRLIRYAALAIAILLPALYISIIGFHFEVVPQNLMYLVKQSVQTIPYNPLVEALIVEIFIELIREGSLRLPAKIGPTIGIVGGLIIGDAIVNAGLVSNLMVVVVALTAISSFIIPNPEMSTTISALRFPFMFLASLLGIYGIIIGLFLLVGHLCKLRPFGVPYLAPLPNSKWRHYSDTIIRAPIITANERPDDALPQNKVRERFFRWWKK